MQKYLLLTITLLFQFHNTHSFPKKMIINQPIVDLRYQPQIAPDNLKLPISPLDNPLQASQLLLGEYVIAHKTFVDKENRTWIKVDAIQQENPEQLYPGWIQANQAQEVEDFPAYNIVITSYFADIIDQDNNTIMTLSIGTRLHGTMYSPNLYKITLPDNRTAFIKNSDIYYFDSDIIESIDQLRQGIVQSAKKFIGNHYSWGGRSAQHEKLFSISGPDCSGLLGLSFLTYGLQIPRMSHEQLLHCNIIQHGKDLQPGDFIFTSFQTRYRYPMDHVMMYIGNGLLIESTMAGEQNVRIISCNDRFGKSHETIQSGDIIYMRDEPCEIYFGTFLNKDMIQKLRNHALMIDYEIVLRKF